MKGEDAGPCTHFFVGPLKLDNEDGAGAILEGLMASWEWAATKGINC